MPSEFQPITIGELISRDGGEIKTGPFGTQLKAHEYTPTGVPLISVGEVGDGRIVLHTRTPRVSPEITVRLPQYVLKEGDIVFGRKGAVERSALVSREQEGWFLGSDGIRLRLPSSCDARYVAFYLQSKSHKAWIMQNATGTTMPSLNQDVISRIPIILPTLSRQKTIAFTLGALDDKIELNRQMNETLEAMARAIFKDWFVDFGPTRTKMAIRGEDPQKDNVARAPYLAADLWALFPDRLDDLGNPNGWVEKPLTAFFEIIGGGTPKTTERSYWDGSIPWFSVVDTPSNIFVFETEKTITERGVSESSVRLIAPGTTIISARGTVGNLAIAGMEMAFNQSCYALKGTNGAGGTFVYLLAQQLVSTLKAMSHGSVFSTITRQTFEAAKFLESGTAVLSAFEATTAPLFEMIKANAQESITLAQTRDLLLPKLMSGEIRIRDAAQA